MDEIDHKLSSMSSVLRKLTLENLRSRFKEEKYRRTLHFICLPKTNENLRTWQKAWSRHRICTVRSSPFRLRLAGQMQDPVGPEVSTLDLNNYGVEGIVNEDQDNRGSRPVFCSLATEIDEQCKTELY